MTSGSLFVKILKLSVPMILSSILQLLFSTADLIVIGQLRGDDSLAAVSATTSLNHLVINLVLGLSVGANVVMSQAIGAKDHARAQRTVHTSMALAVVSGIAFSLLGFFITRPALGVMGTDAEILDKATLYLEIIFIGTIFNVVYNFGSAILRAKGDTSRPLIYLTIAGFVNVALNVVFVAVFGMDVEGVAIPTITSQALSAVLVVIALLREKGDCKLSIKKLRFHTTELKDVVVVGLPSGALNSLFSVSNVLVQAQINSFDSTQFVAGVGVAASLEAFTYVSMNAVSTAASAVVGQNYGAGKKKRVAASLWQSCALLMIVFAIVGGVTMIFSRPLLSLYNPDPVVVDYALERFFVIMPTYFLCGIAEVFVSTLRGMGRSVPPTLVAVVCICAFRVLWVNTAFVWYRSIFTLFLCYPISYVLELIALPIMLAAFYRKIPDEQPEPTPSNENDGEAISKDEPENEEDNEAISNADETSTEVVANADEHATETAATTDETN